MTEGWWLDSYYVLFDEDEVPRLTTNYALDVCIPGFTLVGLKFWDDFIVRDQHGRFFSVPTVPLDLRHLHPSTAPSKSDALRTDPRFTGKIRWFVKPILFGGDPRDERNTMWVTMEQHAQLVRWWNDQYRSAIARKG